MNWFLFSAATLAFIVGLVHSVLGERLIFRRMREAGFIPTNGGRIIGEGHVRILWASWHALTVFGWCIAAMLFWLAQATTRTDGSFMTGAIVAAMLASSALVLVGTNAKHPGWIGLLGVAILTSLARV